MQDSAFRWNKAAIKKKFYKRRTSNSKYGAILNLAFTFNQPVLVAK